MRIGLTYDLRDDYLAAGFSPEQAAEFDLPDTIQAIEEAIRQLGHEPVRIGNIRQLVQKLAAGDRWELVFNIAEGCFGTARESQVPALLDAFCIPYTFADPLTLAIGLDKRLAKLTVAAAGVPTPAFAVVFSLAECESVKLQGPLFLKPLAEGTSKGISAQSVVFDRGALYRVCRVLLERFGPVLVEEYLPGREFTVGVLGGGKETEVLGTLEIILRPEAEAYAYSYRNKQEYARCVEYRLVSSEADPVVRLAEELAVLAWQAVGGQDAGRVDLRCNPAGEPQFLELNPLPGLHPQHSDLPMLATALGIPYVHLIGRIIDSAVRRTGFQNASSCGPAVARL